MTKRDAILLVSRAIAVLQLISAALELSYLPERLFSLSRYSRLVATGAATEASIHFRHEYRLNVGLVLLRFVILMICARIFWSCGPRVERMLCPGEPQVPEMEA